LSTSFELNIRPRRSKLYLRVFLVLFVLSCLGIVHSSLPLVLQGMFIIFFAIQLILGFVHQRPCAWIKELHYQKNEWTLVDVNERSTKYESLKILIHNPLFLLIKLENSRKHLLLVLFKDQLLIDEIRLLFFHSL
jgi:hypothetical protein